MAVMRWIYLVQSSPTEGRTCEIGTRFVGAGGGTGRLPSRNVHGLEVLGHLGHLDRIKTGNP